MVILMPMMPAQPSSIESWSYADLRCNVYERERQRQMDQVNDRPSFSPWDGVCRRKVLKAGARRSAHVSWPMLLIGSAFAMAGGMWLLAILGFEVPWFSALPMALMIAGSFIITAALNRGAVRELTAHDRCDH
jgi:hypothetical protein